MKRLLVLSLASVFLVGFTPVGAGTLSAGDAKKAAKIITPENLRNSLEFIAADALLGRDTPSPGLDAAANFLAFNLKRWGAKPGGENGTFFQPIKLVKPSYDKAASKITSGDVSLSMETDFLVTSGMGTASAAAVYIAKEVGEADVKGKIVLLGRESTRLEEGAAISKGAVGVIRNAGTAGDDWKSTVTARSRFGGGFRMDTAGQEGPAQPAAGFRILANADAFAKLTVGVDLKATTPVAVAKPVDITTAQTVETATTRNVVAIIEGSDPKLKAEYVAVGAHYDHIGVGRGTGDVINNGADDDGSGTVSVLAIAESLLSVKNRPKRSIIFVWHSGEEKGLWGSDYFNRNPTVPKGSIVAQLNIDMIGRSRPIDDTNPANKTLTGPNSIYVIGTTMMSTRLGEIVHDVNKNFEKLDYDAKYDDPKDPNRFFFRSDHYNYARNGIPICFWFDGVHEDYHRPGDEVQKIDFTRMARIAQTVLVTAVTVANEPVRPPVDKPLGR
ncbi:MAG: M28 family peptidase [Fimbriimonas sp.]